MTNLIGAEELAADLDGGARGDGARGDGARGDGVRGDGVEGTVRRPPRIFDVRWVLGGASSYADFLAGHLPGAAWLDLDTDLAAPAAADGRGGRHPLPEPAGLQAVLRRRGLGQGDDVVVYDDGELVPAARAWWVLRWAGIARVRVLDGGLRAWVAAGLPLERGPVTGSAAGDVVVRPGGLPTIDAAAAAALAADGRLLDARAPARYDGRSELVDRLAGHIPGARNLPTASLLSRSGTLRPAAQISAALDALGVPPGPLGASCGSGVTAAGTVLALREAGRDAALYVGSWSDWISDPARPIATTGSDATG